ncbi:recQ-mediated genome instability protein 1 isoform X2 [Ovis aries]|uniref:recQ-mediated genome instability protein 1 isoform X2 n=1 Tax=Ovis aries TaxID=9940 RepID=UPI0029529099|nr:recQ-mediated genome instability protein 1 isoform X2 [Ovis aries]
MPPFPQPTFASSSLPGTPLPLWLQGELRVGSSFKHTAELGLFNLRVSFKSCESCEILAPPPGVKATPSALEALRPFLSNRGYKYSTEQPVLNPVIKSCAPVSNGNRCLIFPLRERNECN